MSITKNALTSKFIAVSTLIINATLTEGFFISSDAINKPNLVHGQMNSQLYETKQAPERVPWDGFRFLKQSSQFVTLPQPFVNSGKEKLVIKPGKSIFFSL